MSIMAHCTTALLWLYQKVHRAGLLDTPFMRFFYVSSYFTYKKYLEDPYEKLAKHYSEFFKEGDILDIGANIGYTAFVFSKKIDKGFKIFAFEPEKRNVEILKQVSQRYGFSHQLVPVAAAVGDRNGEIELWKNEASSADHRVLTEALKKELTGTFETQKTPLVTIDNYLKEANHAQPISFIKIDVQGFEHAVCQGMTETLKNNPNAIVSVEYCPAVIKALGFCPEDLLDFFQDRGYGFYFLNKKNVLEAFNLEKNNYFSSQQQTLQYIDIICARRNLTQMEHQENV